MRNALELFRKTDEMTPKADPDGYGRVLNNDFPQSEYVIGYRIGQVE